VGDRYLRGGEGGIEHREFKRSGLTTRASGPGSEKERLAYEMGFESKG